MGVDNSIHHYSEPPFSQEQARSPLSRIDALYAYRQQGGAMNTDFVRIYEAIKDTLFGLSGAGLVEVARGLGLPADQATNKGVINAFCGHMFPDLARRTLEEHTDYLGALEGRTLDHFAEHGVHAFSTGSFAFKGGLPSTVFSDYDVLVTPSEADGGYEGFLHAINTLPEVGVYGFPGTANGALGGAELVLKAGNAGYGFIRAMTAEGVTVELFIIGENSLPAVSRVGGRIPKLQHTEQGWLQVRSLRAPHEPVIVSQPEPHDNSFVSWPAFQRENGEIEHGLGFFEALVAMIDPHRGQGNALVQAHEETLETGIRLLEHYNPSMNGELPDSMLDIVGYAGKPVLTPERHRAFTQEIEGIRERISK